VPVLNAVCSQVGLASGVRSLVDYESDLRGLFVFASAAELGQTRTAVAVAMGKVYVLGFKICVSEPALLQAVLCACMQ
jgi:hypothetical protein